MLDSQEKKLLSFLAAIQFANIVDFIIMMPLGPQIMKDFAISPAQFGVLISAYSLASGLSGLCSALFIDRFDRKGALLVLTTGFAIGTLLCGLAPSYAVLISARAFAGLFGGVITSQVMAIVGDRITHEKRGSATGIIMMAFSAASVMGVPLSIFIATHMGWHSPFIFLGLFGFFMTGVGLWYLPLMRGHLLPSEVRKHPVSEILGLLTHRQTALPLFLSALLLFTQFLVIPFVSPSLVANLGIDPGDLGYFYLLGGLCTIISSPRVGRWIDRSSSLFVLKRTILISILPFVLMTSLKPIPFVFILMIGMIFFISTSARNIPIFSFLNSRVSPSMRGRYMSLNSCCQSLAMAGGAAVAGMIISKNESGQLLHYARVGYLASGLSVVAWILVQRGFRSES